MSIKEENKKLKKQLEHAKKWMRGEVQQAEKNISLETSQKNQNSFYHKNREDIISENIYKFFPSEALSHFPEHGIEHIISSELIYYHLLQGGSVDGMGVMLGYQKVFDAMLELYITKYFRKYVQTTRQLSPPENSALEKSLFSVIEKKYILSAGRLYEILGRKNRGETSGYYEAFLREFLDKKNFLGGKIFEKNFFIHLEKLIDLEVFGEKRHSGSLCVKETKQARNIYIGNFEDKNCLLYLLAESQSGDKI